MFNHVRPGTRTRSREQGGARIAGLALACFLLGAGASAYWFHQATKGEASTPAVGGAPRELSAVTRSVLRRLDAPIEIRFYSVLDPASVPAPVREFADRVEVLLLAYQHEAGDKIKLVWYNSITNLNSTAAKGDGIKPFNLDKGDACFLGLVVDQDGRREALTQLAPEWEAALESDVTRAISRVLEAKPRATIAAAPAPSDPAILEEVKRAVPNFETVSLEEATGTLREAALKDFKAAVERAENQEKEARQKFIAAQTSGAETEVQAARQRLQQVQAEQIEQLKQISARSQAQVEALRQLKGKAAK